MSRTGGGIVTNNVYSYVLVQFDPHSGGENKSSLLKPNQLGNAEKTKLNLSSLSLKDECYNVKITQSHNDAKSQNVLGAATTFTELFLNVVLNFASNKNCVQAIAASLVPGISQTATEAANLQAWEMVDRVGSVALIGIKTGVTNKGCLNFLNPEQIAKALGQQAVAALQVLKALNIAKKTVEVTSYLVAVVNPVELNNIIQLYYSNLKEACVKVVDDGTLKEEYAAGEVVYPGLKLEAQSFYSDWVKSGFKVKWTAEPGNGTLLGLTGETDSEGKHTVAWTLPNDKSGEVKVKAEILDKEGDHITGSPVTFKTKVIEEEFTYKGDWKFIMYDGDEPMQYNNYTFNESGYSTKDEVMHPIPSEWRDTGDTWLMRYNKSTKILRLTCDNARFCATLDFNVISIDDRIFYGNYIRYRIELHRIN
jgi:hypothetical protein